MHSTCNQSAIIQRLQMMTDDRNSLEEYQCQTLPPIVCISVVVIVAEGTRP